MANPARTIAVQAPLAKPGHLSHLERPNYDFARYVASKVVAAKLGTH
ncbi:hypothetical protein LMG28614_02778 [Paraburkholderia ultramafica]|uniref:Uncharacterized protein n=1 Tax=Paraburkholderia ultramafica TaxID=1544867 RepID=A0A6S7CFX8_9BURK|nr:hypothetical protein [Paraburkholderia ultramafica]CAB3788873.1 hypothetical protein LMG28614_02778 [Paraburkholderia ultramafica]